MRSANSLAYFSTNKKFSLGKITLKYRQSNYSSAWWLRLVWSCIKSASAVQISSVHPPSASRLIGVFDPWFSCFQLLHLIALKPPPSGAACNIAGRAPPVLLMAYTADQRIEIQKSWRIWVYMLRRPESLLVLSCIALLPNLWLWLRLYICVLYFLFNCMLVLFSHFSYNEINIHTYIHTYIWRHDVITDMTSSNRSCLYFVRPRQVYLLLNRVLSRVSLFRSPRTTMSTSSTNGIGEWCFCRTSQHVDPDP